MQAVPKAPQINGRSASGSFCKGKSSRAAKKARREQRATEAAACGDAEVDAEFEEQPFTQPARKQRREESPPSAPSADSKKQSQMPAPRGAPASKPKQTAAAELTPEELEARRTRDRAYAKTAYKKKIAAEAAPVLEGASVYDTTKTGKARKSERAKRDAKSYSVRRIADAVERVGGTRAQQAEALEDALNSKRLRNTAALVKGFSPAEAAAVALFHQKQMQVMLGRAAEAASGKPRANVDADRRGFIEAVCVAVAPSPEKVGSAPSLRARARAISGETARTEGRPRGFTRTVTLTGPPQGRGVGGLGRGSKNRKLKKNATMRLTQGWT